MNPSLQRRLARLLLRIRLQASATAALTAAPLATGLALLAARLAGTGTGTGAGTGTGFGFSFDGLTGSVVLATIGLSMLAAGLYAARRHNLARLVRQVDATFPEAEDSTALALRRDSDPRGAPVSSGAAGLAGLQGLQQALVRDRLLARLQDPGTFRRLRPPRPARQLAGAWLLGSLLLGLAFVVPRLPLALQPAGSKAASDPTASVLLGATLTATPPAYTGLGVQTLASLDAKVPADSRVEWALTLDRDASGVSLVFDDASRLPLTHDGQRRWRGQRTIAVSALYRVELVGAPALAGDPLRRIDAVPDAPPQLTVREPQKTLSLLAEGQKRWELVFDASDDYGLGPATLSVSLAHGTGEQIQVTEQKQTLDGGSDAHHRSYRQTIELAKLGFTQGDDLIVRLDVADNHAPQAQHSSSANFILRWPAEAPGESLGMEGLVQKTLPAYFRSERQIIIDTEALIAEHDTVPAKTFAARADGLGVDQKVLRLRYGQFLGEGFESNAENAPPGHQERAASGSDASAAVDAQAQAALRTLPPEAGPGHEATPQPGFGRADNVLGEFGHRHDSAEAATLLDPETKRVLREALDAMWQAELKLRQALPQEALPFEYKALEAIKQVQQAERIYLARAGQELPQVDAARRLSGERKGLSDRDQPLPPPAAPDSPAPAAWAALGRGARPDLTGLAAWVRRRGSSVPDPLGLLAAVDRLQRTPSCSDCRDALQARLWPLLPVPPAGVVPRRLPDAAGAAYLDALRSTAPRSDGVRPDPLPRPPRLTTPQAASSPRGGLPQTPR